MPVQVYVNDISDARKRSEIINHLVAEANGLLTVVVPVPQGHDAFKASHIEYDCTFLGWLHDGSQHGYSSLVHPGYPFTKEFTALFQVDEWRVFGSYWGSQEVRTWPGRGQVIGLETAKIRDIKPRVQAEAVEPKAVTA